MAAHLRLFHAKRRSLCRQHRRPGTRPRGLRLVTKRLQFRVGVARVVTEHQESCHLRGTGEAHGVIDTQMTRKIGERFIERTSQIGGPDDCGGVDARAVEVPGHYAVALVRRTTPSGPRDCPHGATGAGRRHVHLAPIGPFPGGQHWVP